MENLPKEMTKKEYYEFLKENKLQFYKKQLHDYIDLYISEDKTLFFFQLDYDFATFGFDDNAPKTGATLIRIIENFDGQKTENNEFDILKNSEALKNHFPINEISVVCEVTEEYFNFLDRLLKL